MFSIELSDDFLAASGGTSEGTQDKYFKDGYWYKKDREGGESYAEVLSSLILSCSSLSPDEYVIYEKGTINGSTGCRSRDFLSSGESLVTLYRFCFQLTGRKLDEVVARIGSPEKRAEFVLRFFKDSAGVDLSDYFRKIFTMDLVNLNEDRHFNNLALIREENGIYRPAPVFDNGKSLFVGNYSVKQGLDFAENRKRITARPFSADCEKQYSLFPCGFIIDYDACRRKMACMDPRIRASREFKTMTKSLDYVADTHPELVGSDIECGQSRGAEEVILDP